MEPIPFRTSPALTRGAGGAVFALGAHGGYAFRDGKWQPDAAANPFFKPRTAALGGGCLSPEVDSNGEFL